MPRKIVPSPNEEAELVRRAQEKQKIERLRAARAQAKGWSRKNGASYNQKMKYDEIEKEKENLSVKINELTSKERVLREKLAVSLAEVGSGYNAADKVLSLQLDEQKTLKIEEFSKRAEERHHSALNKLNEMKREREEEERRIRVLRERIFTEENKRTQAVLAAPRVQQPLMELPSAQPQRPLRGLDAFTKTYYHLPGVGVVDEKSLGSVCNARKLAVAEEERSNELQRQLQSAAQAREEQAEVRGVAALQRVQLNTILDTVTAQLDKASLIDRARRQRTADVMPTDIFASSLVRSNALKQKQHNLEHAVEEVFGYQEEKITCEMKLGREEEEMKDDESWYFDQVEPPDQLKSASERLRHVKPSKELDMNESEMELKEEMKNDRKEDDSEENSVPGLSDLSVIDENDLESRPSLNLFFPVNDVDQTISSQNTTERSTEFTEHSAEESTLPEEIRDSAEESALNAPFSPPKPLQQTNIPPDCTLDRYTSQLENKEREETLIMTSPHPIFISPEIQQIPPPPLTSFNPQPAQENDPSSDEDSHQLDTPASIIIHSPESVQTRSISTVDTTMSDFGHSEHSGNFQHSHPPNFQHFHGNVPMKLNESVTYTAPVQTPGQPVQTPVVDKIPGKLFTPYNPPIAHKPSPAIYHEKDFIKLSPKEQEEVFIRRQENMKNNSFNISRSTKQSTPNTDTSLSSNPTSLTQHTLTPTSGSSTGKSPNSTSSGLSFGKIPSTGGERFRNIYKFENPNLVTPIAMSDTISQHTLSDQTSFSNSVDSAENSKVSAENSKIGDASSPSSVSVSIVTLQEQLRRIHNHLKEIEQLRDSDVSRG